MTKSNHLELNQAWVWVWWNMLIFTSSSLYNSEQLMAFQTSANQYLLQRVLSFINMYI